MIDKVEWRIYYGDGTTFSSTDGTPVQAPGLNVQVIRLATGDIAPGTLHSKDYYLYHRERGWFGVMGEVACLDQILHVPDIIAVKAGRTISNVDFRASLAHATTDPDFER